MNKILILILIILLALPIAYSAKPTQVFTGDVGLEIRVPQAEFLKQNEEGQLNLHVYNLSNGFPMTNDTTSCLLHIFNRTGHHVFNEIFDYNEDDGDFFLDIGGGNFSQIGFYSFIIGCNTSTIGGFVSGSFRVTTDGEDDSNLDSTSGLAVEMFVLFLVLGVFSLAFIKLSKLPVLNELLHGLAIVLGLALLLLNIGVIVTIADNASLGVNREIFRLMWIIGWGLYCALVFVVIKFLFNCLGLWSIEKKKKRMGDDDEEHD